MKRSIPRTVALAVVAVVFTIGFTIGRSSTPSQLATDEAFQKVNNQAALKYIDARLATMTGPAKVNYLALQACATEISMIGVYGTVEDNPLLQRWNNLNDRYNALYKQLGTVVALPDNLTAAEDLLCRGDHPVG